MFKMAYNKAKDGHVKHSQRINKISLSLEQAMKRWGKRAAKKYTQTAK